MRITYDFLNNIGYIRFQEKLEGTVSTEVITNDVNIDIAPDGSVYGIEFMNAKEQFGLSVVVENQQTHKLQELTL